MCNARKLIKKYTCITPMLHLYHIYITPVSQLHYTCITPMLHLYHIYVTPVSQLCYTCITPTLHLYHTYVTPVSHLRYTCITTTIHLYHTTLHLYYTEVISASQEVNVDWYSPNVPSHSGQFLKSVNDRHHHHKIL